MKIVIVYLTFVISLCAQAPDLFLLKTYSDNRNLTGWFMSEKYDGVRAYWDGKQLISRSGKVFTAPSFFTQNFPPFALDGELWSKRKDFENIVSIVNTKESGSRWQALKYMVFEIPDEKGNLQERLDILKFYLAGHESTSIELVKQIRINKAKDLDLFFDKILRLGGEGVVIRNGALPYYVGRKKEALKYKRFQDAECEVGGILEGKGKYKGMMGAIECDFQGNMIRIGSGFSDKERRTPPTIGEIITFKYYGLTGLGNPKYPVFLRVRLDKGLNSN